MKKEKRIWPLLTSMALVMLVGIGFIVYPLISNWYTDRVQSSVHSEYTDIIDQTDNKDLEKELEDAQQYNKSLFFVQTEEDTVLPDYDSVLNLSGNGIMGYVEIPAINVNLPIYHSVNENVLQRGAGHMPGTSLPVGGENTHTVISAHSGMSGAKMFSDLDKVKNGDLIFLYVLGETLAYEVSEIEVTLPADIESIKIEQHKDLITLITCTPFGVNTHRLLVHGHRVELSEKEISEEIDKIVGEDTSSTWTEKYLQGILEGLIIFLVVFLIFFFVRLILRKNASSHEPEHKRKAKRK